MNHRLVLLFAFLGGVLSSPTGEVQGDLSEDVSFLFPSSRIAGDSRLTGLQFNVTTPVPDAAPGHNTPCEDYHKLNSSAEKCDFIRTADDCQNSDGFINYLKVIYCSFPNVRPLGFVCLGLWLIYLLITLGVTAEDFFCPNLDVMARTLKLSQNIAGVTLLAFGNGAPDIFSAIAAITNSRNGEAGLAIGALFGAGIFVTTVVAGSIAMSRPFKMVERPFLRDAIFYLVAAFWTFYILYKGSIVFLEAVGYIMLYLLYVSVVIVGRRIYQHQKRRRQEQEQAVETYTPETQERIQAPGGMVSERMKRDFPTTALHPSINSSLHFPSLGTSINSTHVVPSINSHLDDVVPVNGAILRRVDSAIVILIIGEFLLSCMTGDLSATERLAVASILGVDGDVVRSITPLPHHTSDHDSNDYESQPLVRSEAPPPGQVKEFFIGLCPVDLKEWKELACYLKIWELIKCPMLLCLKATVPVVDYNEPKHNWNRLLNTLNLFLAPVFCAFVTKGLTQTITGGFVVWYLVLPISFLLAAAVFLTSKPKKQPVYHAVFSYVGFVVAVLWIYSTANEIVNILQMFGVEFFINDAILGLTVLAWGNSIGDLVADVAMARQGFPTMGMSACFGGPMFNMLLGIGISCTIVTVRDGGTFVLHTDHVQLVLALGLAVSLLSSMFIMVITRFQAARFYGIYLYILYGVILVVALLIELQVIPW
ncbi:mitochondrial sodium/calcium exchanger protein [Strongylocentrotus purpuratus]|uniref:Sodium/calcium exchanger membrane region domain-containing protein n=1 Tax=Strongylocentrotus purpuratus TaxID=7668 RepID=A0A7M7P6W5_STRPU|nr:mitochondrial sodium/calcium exchanger protein [Strongylocentrotus purpuratus]